MAFYPCKPYFSIVELNDDHLFGTRKAYQDLVSKFNYGVRSDAATQPLELFVTLARIAITKCVRDWASVMDMVEHATSTNVCVSFGC